MRQLPQNDHSFLEVFNGGFKIPIVIVQNTQFKIGMEMIVILRCNWKICNGKVKIFQIPVYHTPLKICLPVVGDLHDQQIDLPEAIGGFIDSHKRNPKKAPCRNAIRQKIDDGGKFLNAKVMGTKFLKHPSPVKMDLCTPGINFNGFIQVGQSTQEVSQFHFRHSPVKKIHITFRV